ncbi:MAG TPA: efflux RND transporter permease subunit [Candidatus Rifleibacterium sp.]|nr:efflux RND transporter permease subunit [Candidatus Rifleibacterium sp.]HPT46527.1 efflux RND transporter permease subunit [Candidatus Rifleibacterium sp.]
MILADSAVRRPVSTIMAFMAIALFGILCYVELGVDEFPEVEFPTVTITCVYRGASPETLESKVVDKIEEQIAALNGIESVKSVCAENIARVIAQFKLNRDINVAVQDVRDKVATIRNQLPDAMDSPLIEKLDTGAVPILSLAVAGKIQTAELSKYVKDVVKNRLQSIPGVGAIREFGIREREIKIWIDNDKLNAHQLTAAEVVMAVKSKNIEIPAGKIEDERREFVVKTMGELTDVEAFKRLTIATIDGAQITLGEVAQIEDGIEDERSAGIMAGQNVMGLQIQKQSGSNAVKTAKQVKQAIEDLNAAAPEGVKISIVVDSTPFTEESIHSVMVDIVVGGFLAVIVILVFLRNLTSTLISALAIPSSILASFVIMRIFGLTLNTLTTMGLSLSIGLLVDDAIVVIENIYRHLRMNKTPAQAASDATEEIGLAVTAATFTLVAVFLPVALMSGLVGRFLFHFGITVTAAVLVSLVVSFTLTPMLASRYLTASEADENRVAKFLGRTLDRFDELYRRVLGKVLNWRYTVLAFGAMIIALIVLLSGYLSFEFKPQLDKNLFLVNFRTPVGTSLEGSRQIAAEVERQVIEPMKKYVSMSLVNVATDPLEDPTKCTVNVALIPKAARPEMPQIRLMEQTRKLLAGIAGIERFSVEEMDPIASIGGMANQQLTYSLLGPDMAILNDLADKLNAWMKKVGGYVDIDDSREPGKPELHVQLQRDRMEILGVNVGALAATLNLLVGGEQAISQFKDAGKQYDVKMRLMKAFRISSAALPNLMVRTTDGARTVPLSNVSEIRSDVSPSTINRFNRAREIRVGANLEGKSQGEAMTEFVAEAQKLFPVGYRGEFQGLAKEAGNTIGAMIFAAALATILVYMLLASQFENFLHPLTIMTSVPLGVVGAIMIMIVFQPKLDIMTMIGFLMLMGLVVKNGILLVEFINQQRMRGLSRREAIMVACPIRLRPIIMTSASSMGGMIPAAIATGPGSELRAGMAIAVIGGLITSTALTLLFVPVVYELLEDICAYFGIVVFRETPVAGQSDKSPATTVAAD